MDFRSFQLEVSKGKFHPTYAVVGEETFLRSEIEGLIKSSYLEGEDLEFCAESYSLPETLFGQVLESLKTLPFFGTKKLVFIHGAEKLNQKDMEELIDFLSQTELMGLCAVFFFTKIDKRKKLSKDLLKKMALVDIPVPYENQVPQWISFLCQKHKVKMDRDALVHLQFMVGNSLSELSQAIQKIKTHGVEGQIQVSHLNKILERTSTEDIFKICEMLGQGKIEQAQNSFEVHLNTTGNAVGALQLFHRHFRILSEIQKSRGSGLSDQQLATKVGVPKFFLKGYQAQTRNWNSRKLSQVFTSLQEADLSLKSTSLKPDLIFSELFLKLHRIREGKPLQFGFL